VVWDAADTGTQRGQHGEYNLTREGDRTRVRFDLIIDLAAPIPDFIVRRAKKLVLDTAVDSLHQQVMDKYSA
jgi:hypothetical protein